MLLLVNVLCLILFAFLVRKSIKLTPTDTEYKKLRERYDDCLIAIGSIWAFVFIISIFLCIDISRLSVLDEKISLYEEENQRIEMQMDELTSSYMNYESDVFKNISSGSSINIALITPELKSNELVMEQLKTYKTNNEAIKYLKGQKINGKISRWWLYFGH